MTELTNRELRRVHAVNMAITYYDRLAKTRLLLPKREDVDMGIEIKPDLDELLTTADAFLGYIHDGSIPASTFDPVADDSEGAADE